MCSFLSNPGDSMTSVLQLTDCISRQAYFQSHFQAENFRNGKLPVSSAPL